MAGYKRQSVNLTRLRNLQSPVEGLAISCSYSAHAPLSVTQEHFLVATRTQNGPRHQVCGSQVPVKQRSRAYGICRERVVGSNDENSTPQPIDCPGRAASMSRSLGLNGRSSRRRSSRGGSGGRYIVFTALQHLLTFYFAFVFFAVVAADVEPPVILVSFIHSVVHGLP